MLSKYRTLWKQFAYKKGATLSRPRELLERLSNDDYIDTAVIGGIEAKDLIDGKFAEAQIPKDINQAWAIANSRHAKNGLTFMKHLRQLKTNEERRGLFNSVRGKLFEIRYCDYLNESGKLPDGFHARLTALPTQPDYDIEIVDEHGHVHEVIQNKASATLSYVKAALKQNPSIPIAVPTDVHDTMIERLPNHLRDGHVTLRELSRTMQGAGSHADHANAAMDASSHFHLPVLAFAIACSQNFVRYRKGSISGQEALEDSTVRSGLSFLACTAAWGAQAALHTTGIGIPVSMTTRLLGGQVVHNVKRRRYLANSIGIAKESREQIAALIVIRESGASRTVAF